MKKPRALIAEHDETLRGSLRRLLIRQGCEVLESADKSGALRSLPKQQFGFRRSGVDQGGSSAQDGATLLEVLIVVALLSVAVVGVALMFSQGHSFIVAEGDDRVALYLAQQKIEKLRAGGFGVLQVGDATVVTGCPAEPCYTENPVPGFSSPLYHRTTVVECVGPNSFSPADCQNPVTAKRIRVTVVPPMVKADTVVTDSVLTLH